MSLNHDFVINLKLHKNQTMNEESFMSLVPSRSDSPIKYNILEDESGLFQLIHQDMAWKLSFKEAVKNKDKFAILIQGDSYKTSELSDSYINSLVQILVD